MDDLKKLATQAMWMLRDSKAEYKERHNLAGKLHSALASQAGRQAVPDDVFMHEQVAKIAAIADSPSPTLSALKEKYDIPPAQGAQAVPDAIYPLLARVAGLASPNAYNLGVSDLFALLNKNAAEAQAYLSAIAPKPSTTYQHHPSITEAAKEVAGETAALKAGFAG